QLHEGDAPARAIFELTEKTLDQRMARREELQLFLLHRFAPVERAEKPRAARHTREVLHESVAPELHVERLHALALHEVESVDCAGVEDEPLHRVVESRGDTREDPLGVLAPVTLGMEVVIDGALLRSCGLAYLGYELLDRELHAFSGESRGAL